MNADTVPEQIKVMNRRFAALSKAAPKVMGAFRSLMGEASKEGAVSARIKELVAVAIAIHQGCGDCILFHVANARNHGASRAELVDVLGVTIEMGGGPAAIYAGKALEVFDAIENENT